MATAVELVGPTRLKLSQDKVALIDPGDLGRVLGKWTAWRNPKRKTWYATRNIKLSDGRHTILYLHRRVMELEPGDWQQVDHADGDGLNNQRDNLRLASNQENNQNKGRQKNNTTSIYKGVNRRGPTAKSKPWECRLKDSSGETHRSYHKTEEEAARTYDRLARVLHGEFGHLNFP